MKRILTIVCCAVMLLSVSSCTKKYITPNPNQTIIRDIVSSDWTLYSDPGGVNSYRVPLEVSEIDNASAQYDGVLVSISYDGGDTYEQLPEVYGNLSYSYTYNGGNVTLYAQTPDGGTAVQPSLPIKVKIVLVYSN